ncbi:hypothetical protein QOT17_005747 [Balamuthia mandrillaris]
MFSLTKQDKQQNNIYYHSTTMQKQTSLMLLTACLVAVFAFAQAQNGMPGGFQIVPRSEWDTPEVEAVIEFAVDAIEDDVDGDIKYIKILLIERQIVAGTNWRVTAAIKTEDKMRLLSIVTIFQDLQGMLDLTDIDTFVRPNGGGHHCDNGHHGGGHNGYN